MIKGHTDIDIWNTGFFINADYFSDDFIIYNIFVFTTDYYSIFYR